MQWRYCCVLRPGRILLLSLGSSDAAKAQLTIHSEHGLLTYMPAQGPKASPLTNHITVPNPPRLLSPPFPSSFFSSLVYFHSQFPLPFIILGGSATKGRRHPRSRIWTSGFCEVVHAERKIWVTFWTWVGVRLEEEEEGEELVVVVVVGFGPAEWCCDWSC